MVVLLKILFQKLAQKFLLNTGILNQQEAFMEYPDRLLPKPHYKFISWNDSLCNNYLIHYTEDKDIINPETGKLYIQHVVKQTDHLKNYSNSLLGIYIVDDIYWAIQDCPDKQYLIADWEINSKVRTPRIPEEYQRDESRGCFFLRIGDCNAETVEFEDSTYANPVCHIVHTPTNANFWHVSVKWLFNGQDIESWSNGIKRRMKTTAKAFIVERAFFIEPFYEELDSVNYIN